VPGSLVCIYDLFLLLHDHILCVRCLGESNDRVTSR
jgi:hypothetical protein